MAKMEFLASVFCIGERGKETISGIDMGGVISFFFSDHLIFRRLPIVIIAPALAPSCLNHCPSSCTL